MLFLVTVLAGIFMFNTSAFAEDILYDEVKVYQDGFFEERTVSLFALEGDEKGAYDAIVKALKGFETEVNLISYSLTPEQIRTLLTKVINENPEFFYVDSKYSYSKSGSYVKRLVFAYRYDKSLVPGMLEEIDAETRLALSYTDDGMSDYEKALVIHNYIVTNYEYDGTYTIANIYDFVDKKTGVCQAYSLMYMYVMQKAGIPCTTAPSDEMGHIWNMVRLDGAWYHADLTYDDPDVNSAGDVIGYCSYKYFLKSDSYMLSDGLHYGWESDCAADSTLYDDSFLSSYRSQVIYADGSWYAAAGTAIKKIDINSGEGSVIFSPDISSAPYEWRMYASLNIAPYGQYIIYNTHDAIYALKPGEAKAKSLYMLNDANVNINGLAISGSVVIFQTAENRYTPSAPVFRTDISDILSPYDFAVRSIEAAEGKIKVKYTVNTLFDGEYKVYAAGFDVDGSLVFVKEATGEVDCGEAFLYKAFIWSETQPLCESMTMQK